MDKYMEDALIAAKKANEINEVPVGCVFVYQNKIIASACNLVNATKNATRHAEFICIDKVLEFCQETSLNYNKVFQEISVIVTVEPCIMCAAALYNLKVKEIIYGCANERFGGETVVNVSNFLKSEVPMRGGVRADEALILLKEFYKGENPTAPVPKCKKT